MPTGLPDRALPGGRRVRTASCLTGVFETPSSKVSSPSPRSPTYLYVPREGSRSWTARDEFSDTQWAELTSEFERSNHCAIAYRNRGVLIVRPLDRPDRGRPPAR